MTSRIVTGCGVVGVEGEEWSLEDLSVSRPLVAVKLSPELGELEGRLLPIPNVVPATNINIII